MADQAAFQVIVLGPTGGPREDMVTGILVRSTATQWTLNSMIAVDAGTLLAGIIRTLDLYLTETKEGEIQMKDGPFVGLNMPFRTAQANGAFIFRELIGAFLLTHPHLDHLAGMAINTPILEAGSGPRHLAALPSIVDAIKNHMFNDVIWPNLSDEDGGAGFITYQRLVDGGNPRFGIGEARGYVQVCNGLLTKCLAVSHGRCRQKHGPDAGGPQRLSNTVVSTDPLTVPSRAISSDNSDAGSRSPTRSPRVYTRNVRESVWTTIESSAFFIRDYKTGSEIIVFGDVEPDSISIDPRNKHVWEVAAPKIAAGTLRAIFIECSFDDSVDDKSLYGHLCPRHLVAELTSLAQKVVAVQHPHLAEQATHSAKRKRTQSTPSADLSPKTKRLAAFGGKDRTTDALSVSGEPGSNDMRPRFNSDNTSEAPELVRDGTTTTTTTPTPTPSYQNFVVDGDNDNDNDGDDEGANDNDNDNGPETGAEAASGTENIHWPNSNNPRNLPLTGLSVYIIHIKDTLSDGPHPGVRILSELRAHGEEAGLGCDFYVPSSGEGIYI